MTPPATSTAMPTPTMAAVPTRPRPAWTATATASRIPMETGCAIPMRWPDASCPGRATTTRMPPMAVWSATTRPAPDAPTRRPTTTMRRPRCPAAIANISGARMLGRTTSRPAPTWTTAAAPMAVARTLPPTTLMTTPRPMTGPASMRAVWIPTPATSIRRPIPTTVPAPIRHPNTTASATACRTTMGTGCAIPSRCPAVRRLPRATTTLRPPRTTAAVNGSPASAVRMPRRTTIPLRR